MGGVPSREATTLYSYFRGTYEIGLIPLTKAFFGRPTEANDNFPPCMTATAQRASTEELRRQFVLMRSDPAIVYANMRMKTSASWQELLSDGFTEDDLDAFLEKVEEGLYNTDAEMVADSQAALVPIPCALCLACKEGQERSGSFSWNGRSIVVIGYFGCMERRPCSAFKVMKGNHVVNAAAPGSGTGDCNDDGNNNNSHSNLDMEMGNMQLFLNAAVLSSAGDRTLERVLILAAVMLRNQYLDAVTHALSPADKSLSTPNGLLDVSGSLPGASSFSLLSGSSVDCIKGINNASVQQVREEALRTLEQRLRHLTVNVETAIDNYSSLKSLTENIAFLQCQTTVDPSLCVLHLPQAVLKATGAVNAAEVGFGEREGADAKHAEESRSSASCANTAVMMAAAVTTKMETETISTGKRDGDASCGVSHDDIVAPFQKEERAANSNCMSESEGTSPVSASNQSGMHTLGDENAPLELVFIRFMPKYVAQAIIWASGLLTSPTRLANGRWVQYKLKDESEELRQTLHGRDTIVANWREECKEVASIYMGECTELLLRHVRFLQDEVEKARSLPINSWADEDLMKTREGRTCALHRTPFGTMLVGIRNRREGNDLRKQDQKKHLPRETNGHASNVNASPYYAFIRDPGSCVSNRCTNPCQTKNMGPGSALGVPSLDGVQSMPSFSGYRGLEGILPGAMCGAGTGGFMTPLPFFPPMQPSSSIAPPSNFVPGTVVLPYFMSAAGDASNMDQKRKSGSSLAPPPLYQPISTASASNAFGSMNASHGSDIIAGSSSLSSSSPSTVALSNTTMQAPPYPYMLGNATTASPGGTIVTAGPGAPAQQQFVLVSQGSGGVPVLVPIATSAPQQSSFVPLYGYHPYGASGSPQVAMSSSPTPTVPPSWSPPNTAGGGTAGVAVAGNGSISNCVYYLPTQ